MSNGYSPHRCLDEWIAPNGACAWCARQEAYRQEKKVEEAVAEERGKSLGEQFDEAVQSGYDAGRAEERRECWQDIQVLVSNRGEREALRRALDAREKEKP